MRASTKNGTNEQRRFLKQEPPSEFAGEWPTLPRWVQSAPLLSWREVSLLGTHLVAAIVAVKVDGPKGAIRLEVGGNIGERVLAAQLLLNLLEAGGHLFHRGWEKGLPASRLGHVRQHLVTAASARRPVRADRIDDRLGPLAFLDLFLGMHTALVIVAVGDQKHGLANRLLSARDVKQLVAAGRIDRVKKRRAPARTHAVDARLKSVEIVGPIRLDSRSHIETHHESPIASRLQDID